MYNTSINTRPVFNCPIQRNPYVSVNNNTKRQEHYNNPVKENKQGGLVKKCLMATALLGLIAMLVVAGKKNGVNTDIKLGDTFQKADKKAARAAAKELKKTMRGFVKQRKAAMKTMDKQAKVRIKAMKRTDRTNFFNLFYLFKGPNGFG